MYFRAPAMHGKCLLTRDRHMYLCRYVRSYSRVCVVLMGIN